MPAYAQKQEKKRSFAAQVIDEPGEVSVF